MKMNNEITVSILRIINLNEKLEYDENNENYVEVKYENGMYKISKANKYLDSIRNSKLSQIQVKINENMEEVIKHLIYRTQKEKLNPIESALIFKEIKNITDAKQKKLSELLGKTQGNISNKMRLLKLPLFLQINIINNEITERHGRAFLQLYNKPNAEQNIKYTYKEMIQKKLNVEETENIINKLLGKNTKKKTKLEKVNDKRELRKKIAIPAINQINEDLKKCIDLINKYNPELDIQKIEGLENNDYVVKVIIKNVK